MQRDVTAVEAFLHGGGIPAAAIAESVVQSETIVTRISKKKTRTTYRVSQGLDVSTAKIDVVEGVSTRLADLIERGIDVSAEPLEYISTDLEQAKLDALQAATEEARRRADILVQGPRRQARSDAVELARRVPDHPARLDRRERLRHQRHVQPREGRDGGRQRDLRRQVSSRWRYNSSR